MEVDLEDKKGSLFLTQELPGGARLMDVVANTDARGTLLALEQGRPFPFAPKRTFLISNVPSGASRAEHSVSCNEFLIAISGQCRVTLRTTEAESILVLRAGEAGLYVPAGIWMRLDRFDDQVILLVNASESFDDTEYFDMPRI